MNTSFLISCIANLLFDRHLPILLFLLDKHAMLSIIVILGCDTHASDYLRCLIFNSIAMFKMNFITAIGMPTFIGNIIFCFSTSRESCMTTQLFQRIGNTAQENYEIDCSDS